METFKTIWQHEITLLAFSKLSRILEDIIYNTIFEICEIYLARKLFQRLSLLYSKYILL